MPDEIVIEYEGDRYFQSPDTNPECGPPRCHLEKRVRSDPVPAPSFGAGGEQVLGGMPDVTLYCGVHRITYKRFGN
jgi:hypothetical protein